jgi:hypothetical protein
MENERARAIAVREEAQRRAKMSDDQRLLEVKGVDKDVLAQLKAGGWSTVDQLAREQDIEKLTAAGISPKRAAYLQHFARIWLGELPADAPLPEAAGGGDPGSVDEGWN